MILVIGYSYTLVSTVAVRTFIGQFLVRLKDVLLQACDSVG
jgi:hypothetical protein